MSCTVRPFRFLFSLLSLILGFALVCSAQRDRCAISEGLRRCPAGARTSAAP